MSKHIRCAYCGQPLESWSQRHTAGDCEAYLKDHPEGGVLYKKLSKKDG